MTAFIPSLKEGVFPPSEINNILNSEVSINDLLRYQLEENKKIHDEYLYFFDTCQNLSKIRHELNNEVTAQKAKIEQSKIRLNMFCTLILNAIECREDSIQLSDIDTELLKNTIHIIKNE